MSFWRRNGAAVVAPLVVSPDLGTRLPPVQGASIPVQLTPVRGMLCYPKTGKLCIKVGERIRRFVCIHQRRPVEWRTKFCSARLRLLTALLLSTSRASPTKTLGRVADHYRVVN